ncbi:Lrp/AsnC family transcriptional regulator [Caldimonas manganoxidans]|uniref:Lrp/AsnC family transcriptional regulator n=1 Tax=Caldimonas manganoxidans TaxID=196015 RepID=UPI00037C38B2|nr:Lrp/AsnC family transcriptional regulator [Caldimonas manganoxidans]
MPAHTMPAPPAHDLDAIDRRVLEVLQTDGRISNVDLASRVHLSAPQCLRRVRSLEERGVIRGYAAQVDRQALGLTVMAFVGLTIDREQFTRVRELEKVFQDFPEVIECHSVSGDHDYLLKVVAPDLRTLSQFLTDRLMQVPGVDNVRSTICLEEIKPPSALPVG